jgi:hypothetical protein
MMGQTDVNGRALLSRPVYPGCQNPSLTYMALSARAAHHAAEFLKAGKL